MNTRKAFLLCLYGAFVFSFSRVNAEEIRAVPSPVPAVASLNEPSRANPAPSYVSTTREEGEYELGPEDVLHITIYPDEELGGDYTVGYDGKISINRIGTIRAGGKTVSSIENIIRKKLSRYVRHPEVSINIISFKSRKVLVIGQVESPGAFPLKGSTQILDILTKANWKEGKADLENIKVLRKNGEVRKINLKNLLERGDFSQNITLHPRDTIFVPEKKEEEKKTAESFTTEEGKENLIAEAEKKLAPESFTVIVLGAVKSPGPMTYLETEILTVKQALNRAGWYSKNANLRKAKVIRANGIQEPVDLSRLIFQADLSQDLILYPEDTLYIPESKEIKVYVLGEVKKPGMYTTSEKMNVMQAVALADNSKFGALLRNTKVVRGWPNHPVVYNVNLEKLLYKGDISQNMELKDGDVVYLPTGFLKNTLTVWNKLLGPINNTAITYDNVRLVAQGKSPQQTSSVVITQ